MKENKKSRNWFNIEYRHIQNKKLVVTVSVLLRLSVVGTLVAQAFMAILKMFTPAFWP